MNKALFTTPEQAKKLLKAGFKAQTADCVRRNNTIYVTEKPHDEIWYVTHRKQPVWSYGRLLELYLYFSKDHITLAGAFDISVLINELIEIANNNSTPQQLIDLDYGCK